MGRQRDYALDVIRTISILMVVSFHLIAHWDRPQGILYSYANGKWGSTGVGMFFLLSGFLLWSHYHNGVNIKSFYQKRLLSIYIPFYLSYILGSMIFVLVNGNFIKGIPKWHFLFTLMGCDAYVSFLTDSTFYFGIGEWFTTIIIFLYLLFPFLNILFRKAFVGSTGLIVLWYGWNYFHPMFGISQEASLPTGLLLFWMGMLLAKCEDVLLSKRWVILFMTVCVSCVVIFVELPKGVLQWKYLLSVSLFLGVFLLFRSVGVPNIAKPALEGIYKISFEIYLLHHYLIIVFEEVFLADDIHGSRTVILCGVYLITLLVLSYIVYTISEYIKKRCTYGITFCGKFFCSFFSSNQ